MTLLPTSGPRLAAALACILLDVGGPCIVAQTPQPTVQTPAPIVRVPVPPHRVRPATGDQTTRPDASPSPLPSVGGLPKHRAAPTGATTGTPTVSSTSGAARPVSHAGDEPHPAVHTPTPAASSVAPAEHKAGNTVNGLHRDVVVLDAGHGGADSGARIGDNTLEKNVTLALAFRLRSLLLARGFTVVMTRDGDAATFQTSPSAAPTPMSLDDRAGLADHAHAAACLLLHATGRGTGLHLYSTEMTSASAEPYLVPWLTAQAAWVPASRALEAQLTTALGRSHIAVLSSQASVRPVDSLTCPALVLELAPEDSTVASINDAGYQERVAAAVAAALVFWQNAVQPPPRLPAPVVRPHVTASATASAPPRPPTAPEVQP